MNIERNIYSARKRFKKCVREETAHLATLKSIKNKLRHCRDWNRNCRKVRSCDQANRWQKMSLVWRKRKKISQIINAYLYWPFFLLIILWFMTGGDDPCLLSYMSEGKERREVGQKSRRLLQLTVPKHIREAFLTLSLTNLFLWCGMAQYGSASACCKAGPSSILGSAPQGGFSHWAYKRWGDGERPRRMATDKCIVWMWLNECMS